MTNSGVAEAVYGPESTHLSELGISAPRPNNATTESRLSAPQVAEQTEHHLGDVHLERSVDPELGHVRTLSSASSTVQNTASTSCETLSTAATKEPWHVQAEASTHMRGKKGHPVWRWLRWKAGSIYRRVFAIAFLANLAALAVLAAHRWVGGGALLTSQGASTAVAVNVLALLLVRNENTVNLLFLACGTPLAMKAPLWVRHRLAKVYSYGGIHSGCGISSAFWFVAFLCLVATNEVPHDLLGWKIATLSIGGTIMALLATIIVSAHPAVRRMMHNWFEWSHRFMGWSLVALFWALVLVSTGETATTTRLEDDSVSLASAYSTALVSNPTFWLLLPITALVVYAWIHLRKRKVIKMERSEHCVRLWFDYATVYFGQAVRLSDAPLKETHAFAVIPNTQADEVISALQNAEKGKQASSVTVTELPYALVKSAEAKEGFSVIISRAGDWTSRIIDSPPTEIYTRGLPQFGVLRIAALFSPVLVVATGSGIGPCLSLFVQKPDHPVRILWTSPGDPAGIYGQGVVDSIYRADPKAVIINTRPAAVRGGGGVGGGEEVKRKRPDTLKLAYAMWKESACEACVIISNQRVTQQVVYGLESRGLRTFGAIFDS